LIPHRKSCKGNNPPETKSCDERIRYSIEKRKAFIGAEIVKREKKGRNNQESNMAENKERMDAKGINYDN
jgi:hypothetical protein